jgi:hypothetical protein
LQVTESIAVVTLGAILRDPVGGIAAPDVSSTVVVDASVENVDTHVDGPVEAGTSAGSAVNALHERSTRARKAGTAIAPHTPPTPAWSFVNTSPSMRT